MAPPGIAFAATAELETLPISVPTGLVRATPLHAPPAEAATANELEALPSMLVPRPFTAAARQLYERPIVKPLNTAGFAGVVPRTVRPPSGEVQRTTNWEIGLPPSSGTPKVTAAAPVV